MGFLRCVFIAYLQTVFHLPSSSDYFFPPQKAQHPKSGLDFYITHTQ
jgi:hypothetical protein